MAWTNYDILAAVSCLIGCESVRKKSHKKSILQGVAFQEKPVSHTNFISEPRIYPFLLHWLPFLSLKKLRWWGTSFVHHKSLTATLRLLDTGRSYEEFDYSATSSPKALDYIISRTQKVMFIQIRQNCDHSYPLSQWFFHSSCSFLGPKKIGRKYRRFRIEIEPLSLPRSYG